MRKGIVGIAIVAISVAACSSSGGEKPGPTVTRTLTATVTATVTDTPSPLATPAPSSGFKLGQVFTVQQAGTTATVLKFDPSAPGGGVSKGKKNVAILVKVCAVTKATSVGYGPWSLIDTQDGTSGTTVTGGGLEEPQYLDDNDLNKGDCARGWLTFEVAKSQTIATVKYLPGDGKGDHLPYAKWRVQP